MGNAQEIFSNKGKFIHSQEDKSQNLQPKIANNSK